MEMEDYMLLADKPGLGQQGDIITLHPRQAEYLIMAGVLATRAREIAAADTGRGEPRRRRRATVLTTAEGADNSE